MIGLAALLLMQTTAGKTSASSDVVVTGRPLNRAKAVRHMTARVAAMGDATRPLARFGAPICPAVDGVPQAVAARFVRRMRSDAGIAGVAVDPEGCAPNITVLFVPSGQEVVRALHKSHAEIFGNLQPDQVRRLAADAGPVHLWSFTEIKSRDDDRLRQGTTLAGKDAPELQVRDASIINAPIRLIVEGAIMLIDQQASVGKTIDQLADYAAMRILAQARPIGSDAAEPTILRLFDTGQPPPRALTAFDTAYLKAVYRGEATQLPFGRISTMARSINKALSGAVAASEATRN